jgi:hypothetical protein
LEASVGANNAWKPRGKAARVSTRGLAQGAVSARATRQGGRTRWRRQHGLAVPQASQHFGKEDKGTNDLIAPLDWICEVQLELDGMRSRRAPFTAMCLWQAVYVAHSRRPVTGEQATDIVGGNGQPDDVWLRPNICSENRGEVCNHSEDHDAPSDPAA